MKRDYLKTFYRIFALCIILALHGCCPYSKQMHEYKMPPEMEGCKVYAISDGSKDLFVVVCPNTPTSSTWIENCGKNCYKTTHVNLVYR